MDILPANIDLSAAEIQLVSEVAREQTLQRLLRQVRSRYDFILIDCAPSLGLLTINALTAADKVIMPLECEFFALRGIALLTDTIAKVQDRLNPELEILGILGTMYDPRTLHAREVLERVVDAFGDTVFHSVIRRTVKFPETTVAGEPITTLRVRLGGRGVLPDAGEGGRCCGVTPGEAAGCLRAVPAHRHRDTRAAEIRGRADRPGGAAGRGRHPPRRRPPRRPRPAAPDASGTTRRSPCTSAATSCWRWSRLGCGSGASSAWPSTAAGWCGPRSRTRCPISSRPARTASWCAG